MTEKYRHPIQIDIGGQESGEEPVGDYVSGLGPTYEEIELVPDTHKIGLIELCLHLHSGKHSVQLPLKAAKEIGLELIELALMSQLPMI